MTFEQYILNPAAKKSALLNAYTRELLRVKYRERFDNILLRENGKIEYYPFHNAKDNTYWLYLKIPSETVKKFYYDVVLKFIPNQTTFSSENLFKYDVQFFSNDPAFVYTYANVFLKNNLFINELKSKMSKEALKNEPNEKNPSKDIGYVKTLYFAYLLMEARGLNKLLKFKVEMTQLNPAFLIKNIEKADEKIEQRQTEGAKVSHKKKHTITQDQFNALNSKLNNTLDSSAFTIKSTRHITPKRKINHTVSDELSVKHTKTTRSTKRK